MRTTINEKGETEHGYNQYDDNEVQGFDITIDRDIETYHVMGYEEQMMRDENSELSKEYNLKSFTV